MARITIKQGFPTSIIIGQLIAALEEEINKLPTETRWNMWNANGATNAAPIEPPAQANNSICLRSGHSGEMAHIHIEW